MYNQPDCSNQERKTCESCQFDPAWCSELCPISGTCNTLEYATKDIPKFYMKVFGQYTYMVGNIFYQTTKERADVWTYDRATRYINMFRTTDYLYVVGNLLHVGPGVPSRFLYDMYNIYQMVDDEYYLLSTARMDDVYQSQGILTKIPRGAIGTCSSLIENIIIEPLNN